VGTRGADTNDFHHPRPGRGHAGIGLRSTHSVRPPAGVPERFAATAAAVGGRTKRF